MLEPETPGHEQAHEPAEQGPEREPGAFALPSWIDDAIARSRGDEKMAGAATDEEAEDTIASTDVDTVEAFDAAATHDGARLIDARGSDATGLSPSFIGRDLPPSLRANRIARARALSAALWVATVVLLGGAVAVLFFGTEREQLLRPALETTGMAQTVPPRREAAPGSAKATSRSAPQLPRPEGAAASGRFAINVGTFRSEESATAERTRLAAATGLPTRTVKLNEAGVALYRVTLGSFATHDEAEKEADQLVQSGLAAEAFVMPLTGAEHPRP